jgi:hypothetical protein
MAWELRIGRPDLPRVYDDGGLIDVNHVPPQVLATLPGCRPGSRRNSMSSPSSCPEGGIAVGREAARATRQTSTNRHRW